MTEKVEENFNLRDKLKYTQNDCKFVLLAKLPSGKIHQVVIDQGYIQYAINQTNHFKVLETPIEGITF